MKLWPVLVLIASVFVLAVTLAFLAIFERLEWLDIPFHIMGGFAWALIAQILITKAQAQKLPNWFNLIFAIGFVLIIGSLWEYAEFQSLLPQPENAKFTLRDTLGDLLYDSIGATIAWYFYIKN